MLLVSSPACPLGHLLWHGDWGTPAACRPSEPSASPFFHPAAALENTEDEELLLIEDTLSNHTDLTDNEPVLYEVQKQFMR